MLFVFITDTSSFNTCMVIDVCITNNFRCSLFTVHSDFSSQIVCFEIIFLTEVFWEVFNPI